MTVAILPAVLAPGTYELCPDRCVVEVALRVLGRPLLRGRFRASRGTLVVGEPGTVTLDLPAKSLRVNVPLLRAVLVGSNWLWVARHRTIGFAATVAWVEEARGLDVSGTVRVRRADHELPLHARVVYVDRDTVVLAARGVLVKDEFPSRLHVEVAAEFRS